MNKLIIILMFWTSIGLGQKNNPAYQIFNAKGNKVSYKNMVRSLRDTDVLFFGEYHDNSIAHWLQLELLMDLDSLQDKPIKLGFEMFEADQQNLLTDYVSGQIKASNFEEKARLWTNYETDYKPLIEYAKQHNIACYGTNAPAKYASQTYKQGILSLDTIPETEKAFLANLPIRIDTSHSQYQLILEMSEHGGRRILEAQALRDATMAHFIITNYSAGQLFIHFNGSFHSDFHQGILNYLKELPQQTIVHTITTVTQDNLKKLDKENLNRADYILVVNPNVTKTH